MPSVTMTAQWVDRVKPPAAGQVDYFDAKLPGFGLRVSHGGKRAWVLLYRLKGDPRKRRLTLGEYPALSLADARDDARAKLVDVDRGDDPAAEKQADKAAMTFAELAADYLERHAKKVKRSWKEDERILTHDLLPAWGRRKAHEITRRDVMHLLDAIADRGAPIQANRTRALVSKVYNWALGRDLVLHNPCLQVKAVATENQRDRVLSESEIRAVWREFEGLDTLMGAIFKLRLLTAQRGGEVETMRWADVDLAAGWWTIPAEFAKNGLSHRVPLAPQVVAVLRGVERVSRGGAWVFPSPKRKGHHINSVNKAAERIKAGAGVDFTPHDLRRTAASHMTGMGISRLVVSKILNHVEQGITRVYDRHSYDAEKRQALDAWAERLGAIVEESNG